MVTPAKRAPAKKAVPTKKAPARRSKPPQPLSVKATLDVLLKTLDLDEAGKTKAAIAGALAAKLDEAALSDSGAVAMATAGIAKELREVVDAILEATASDGEFVADLFATSPNVRR